MKEYQYITSCVESTAEDITPMVDDAIDITWDTFRKHVPQSFLHYLFPFYAWKGKGLHIKDDYAVSFHRSKFKGERCYYVRHSAIEYVFVRRK